MGQPALSTTVVVVEVGAEVVVGDRDVVLHALLELLFGVISAQLMTAVG